MADKVFRYKLDFYYQQTVIYLLTLVLYTVIRGSFIENQFSFVFKDPILYIIVIFCVISIAVLLLNIWRGRKLVIESDRIVFHSRNRERVFMLSDIEWMHIGKERLTQTAGHFQQVSIKFRNKPLPIRIRVGRYERSRDLVREMEKISATVPKKVKKFRFRRRR